MSTLYSDKFRLNIVPFGFNFSLWLMVRRFTILSFNLKKKYTQLLAVVQ